MTIASEVRVGEAGHGTGRLGDEEGQAPRGEIVQPPLPVGDGRWCLLEGGHGVADVVRVDAGHDLEVRRGRCTDDRLWCRHESPRFSIVKASAIIVECWIW